MTGRAEVRPSAVAAVLGWLGAAFIALAVQCAPTNAASVAFAPAATGQAAAAPHGYWLGLNGNSASNLYTHEPQGQVDEFARYGIAYDRSFEIFAGQLPSETEGDGRGGTLLEDKLALDHRYGMIPVSTIEYRGYRANFSSDPYFPAQARTGAEQAEGKTTIAQYVAGFVRTAAAILSIVNRQHPGMPVLFEPMNEPWGYTTPLFNGAQYAHVIAQLLPAVQAAGIPLADIYVAAFGADARLNARNEAEPFSPGWIAAMYEAEPSLRSEVQGWYFHPYGPPSGPQSVEGGGIQSVPDVRRQMSSGENNIIVSEVGFCAQQQGGDCHESGPAEVETGSEAAEELTLMLDSALPYREAGWLRALIVYGRGDGGWAMVDPSTKLPNAQGEALESFALAHPTGVSPTEACSEPNPFSVDATPPALLDDHFLEHPFGGASACNGEAGTGARN